MFHLTENQASILISDFSYLDKRQNETVSSQLQYMKQKPWQATILHTNGLRFVKMHWSFQTEGFFISGLEDDKCFYYEHLGILEDVEDYEASLMLENNDIEYGVELEVFAKVYSQRMLD